MDIGSLFGVPGSGRPSPVRPAQEDVGPWGSTTLLSQRLVATSLHPTISKDNTAGEGARRANLLAHLGSKTRRCAGETLYREPPIRQAESPRDDRDEDRSAWMRSQGQSSHRHSASPEQEQMNQHLDRNLELQYGNFYEDKLPISLVSYGGSFEDIPSESTAKLESMRTAVAKQGVEQNPAVLQAMMEQQLRQQSTQNYQLLSRQQQILNSMMRPSAVPVSPPSADDSDISPTPSPRGSALQVDTYSDLFSPRRRVYGGPVDTDVYDDAEQYGPDTTYEGVATTKNYFTRPATRAYFRHRGRVSGDFYGQSGSTAFEPRYTSSGYYATAPPRQTVTLDRYMARRGMDSSSEYDYDDDDDNDEYIEVNGTTYVIPARSKSRHFGSDSPEERTNRQLRHTTSQGDAEPPSEVGQQNHMPAGMQVVSDVNNPFQPAPLGEDNYSRLTPWRSERLPFFQSGRTNAEGEGGIPPQPLPPPEYLRHPMHPHPGYVSYNRTAADMSKHFSPRSRVSPIEPNVARDSFDYRGDRSVP